MRINRWMLLPTIFIHINLLAQQYDLDRQQKEIYSLPDDTSKVDKLNILTGKEMRRVAHNMMPEALVKIALKQSQGIGWSNIQNRVDFLKGTFDIKSEKEKGTSVYIELNI